MGIPLRTEDGAKRGRGRTVVWLALLGAVALVVAALWASRGHVEMGSVLVVELGGELEEQPAQDLLGQLSARGPSLPSLLLMLDMAAVDPRVSGVLVHVRPLAVGYARLQELRDALGRVRKSGKKVVALVDVASLNATRELFLASAADQVFIEPGSLAPLAGVAGQFLQMAGAFEKIGVHWEYARIGEYKSAVEQFGAKEMSAEAREMMNRLLDGIFAELTTGIANGRNLSVETVRELVERAPGAPAELVEAKLADGIVGRERVLAEAGFADAPELEAIDYQRVNASSVGLRIGPKIALVFASGAIVDQRGRGFSELAIADEIIPALESARDDDSIRAVVLRINSGGGSSQASERLWRAIRSVREKKPVVVSMAEAAASGGYYIASAANAIVAEPTTLTGSIGVYLMRPSFDETYTKLGIATEVISRGAHASMATTDRGLEPAQRERLDVWVRATYDQFLGRVSEGRGMQHDAIDAIGRGRVWLGNEALGHGLVDELGGLYAAVERARREAKIEGEPDPVRVILPAPRSTGDQIRELISGRAFAGLMRAWLPESVARPLALFSWLPAPGEIAFLPTQWLELY